MNSQKRRIVGFILVLALLMQSVVPVFASGEDVWKTTVSTTGGSVEATADKPELEVKDEDGDGCFYYVALGDSIAAGMGTASAPAVKGQTVGETFRDVFGGIGLLPIENYKNCPTDSYPYIVAEGLYKALTGSDKGFDYDVEKDGNPVFGWSNLGLSGYMVGDVVDALDDYADVARMFSYRDSNATVSAFFSKLQEEDFYKIYNNVDATAAVAEMSTTFGALICSLVSEQAFVLDEMLLPASKAALCESCSKAATDVDQYLELRKAAVEALSWQIYLCNGKLIRDELEKADLITINLGTNDLFSQFLMNIGEKDRLSESLVGALLAALLGGNIDSLVSMLTSGDFSMEAFLNTLVLLDSNNISKEFEVYLANALEGYRELVMLLRNGEDGKDPINPNAKIVFLNTINPYRDPSNYGLFDPESQMLLSEDALVNIDIPSTLDRVFKEVAKEVSDESIIELIKGFVDFENLGLTEAEIAKLPMSKFIAWSIAAENLINTVQDWSDTEKQALLGLGEIFSWMNDKDYKDQIEEIAKGFVSKTAGLIGDDPFQQYIREIAFKVGIIEFMKQMGADDASIEEKVTDLMALVTSGGVNFFNQFLDTVVSASAAEFWDAEVGQALVAAIDQLQTAGAMAKVDLASARAIAADAMESIICLNNLGDGNIFRGLLIAAEEDFMDSLEGLKNLYEAILTREVGGVVELAVVPAAVILLGQELLKNFGDLSQQYMSYVLNFYLEPRMPYGKGFDGEMLVEDLPIYMSIENWLKWVSPEVGIRLYFDFVDDNGITQSGFGRIHVSMSDIETSTAIDGTFNAVSLASILSAQFLDQFINDGDNEVVKAYGTTAYGIYTTKFKATIVSLLSCMNSVDELLRYCLEANDVAIYFALGNGSEEARENRDVVVALTGTQLKELFTLGQDFFNLLNDIDAFNVDGEWLEMVGAWSDFVNSATAASFNTELGQHQIIAQTMNFYLNILRTNGFRGLWQELSTEAQRSLAFSFMLANAWAEGFKNNLENDPGLADALAAFPSAVMQEWTEWILGEGQDGIKEIVEAMVQAFTDAAIKPSEKDIADLAAALYADYQYVYASMVSGAGIAKETITSVSSLVLEFSDIAQRFIDWGSNAYTAISQFDDSELREQIATLRALDWEDVIKSLGKSAFDSLIEKMWADHNFDFSIFQDQQAFMNALLPLFIEVVLDSEYVSNTIKVISSTAINLASETAVQELVDILSSSGAFARNNKNEIHAIVAVVSGASAEFIQEISERAKTVSDLREKLEKNIIKDGGLFKTLDVKALFELAGFVDDITDDAKASLAALAFAEYKTIIEDFVSNYAITARISLAAAKAWVDSYGQLLLAGGSMIADMLDEWGYDDLANALLNAIGETVDFIGAVIHAASETVDFAIEKQVLVPTITKAFKDVLESAGKVFAEQITNIGEYFSTKYGPIFGTEEEWKALALDLASDPAVTAQVAWNLILNKNTQRTVLGALEDNTLPYLMYLIIGYAADKSLAKFSDELYNLADELAKGNDKVMFINIHDAVVSEIFVSSDGAVIVDSDPHPGTYNHKAIADAILSHLTPVRTLTIICETSGEGIESTGTICSTDGSVALEISEADNYNYTMYLNGVEIAAAPQTFQDGDIFKVLFEEKHEPEQPSNPSVPSGPSSSFGPREYTVTLDPNGGNLAEKEFVGLKGDEITAVPTKVGYNFLGWFTAKEGGKKVETITKSTTLYAHWELANVDVADKYIDVNKDDWFYGSVQYLASIGAMEGIDEDEFGPLDIGTRAQVVQILYNIQGCPSVSGSVSYPDVKKGDEWYDAVVWGTQNKVVLGYGNGNFGPEDPITREQLALVLMRYTGDLGLDNSARANITKFADYKNVSDYATDAMRWAVATKLIQGNDLNQLNPGSDASRAEIAAILERYAKTILGK